MRKSELNGHLTAYRMTFYWGTFSNKWWLIGHAEHGCAQVTLPSPAENITAAQKAALEYIQRKYKLASFAMDPS